MSLRVASKPFIFKPSTFRFFYSKGLKRKIHFEYKHVVMFISMKPVFDDEQLINVNMIQTEASFKG